ncbi:MAG: hypothetical protein A2W93_02800 [Bacteroidetes bacterium GWF2_43_63]|nr:MAG: hypothetical protein A2W93_02800 [Bacteroidetes bacterium GWF2_43_63]
MAHNGEYQGGHYAIVEFIGLNCRYFVFKIAGSNKSKVFLSGEEHYPLINRRQRFYCLSVGLIVIIAICVSIIISIATFSH